MIDSTGVSTRMSTVIAAVMPKIAVTVANKTSTATPNIDLATAENWLVRDELITLFMEAVAKNLNHRVMTLSHLSKAFLPPDPRACCYLPSIHVFLLPTSHQPVYFTLSRGFLPRLTSTSRQTLSYPQGFGGDPAILSDLASFFNTYFRSAIPVHPSHIAVVGGASSCLDQLMYTICDAGDSVLVPAPYWSTFSTIFYFSAIVLP